MHSVRQTNKRCTMSATIIRIRACSSGWKPCGSRVRVYRITRSHNCAPSLPIPCDPISSCITQAVEALKHLTFHCPQSMLRAHRDTIEAQVRAHPPQTINEAVAMLAALTGIKRSPTQVRLFLKHLGLQRRKVGVLPAKGDPKVQEEYQKKVGATLSRSTSG